MNRIMFVFLFSVVFACTSSKKQEHVNFEIPLGDQLINYFTSDAYNHVSFYQMNFGVPPKNGVDLVKFLDANKYLQIEDSVYRDFLVHLEFKRNTDDWFTLYQYGNDSIASIEVLPLCGSNETVFSVTVDSEIKTDSINWIKDSIIEFKKGLSRSKDKEYSYILIEINSSSCGHLFICNSDGLIDDEHLSKSIDSLFSRYQDLDVPISILMTI